MKDYTFKELFGEDIRVGRVAYNYQTGSRHQTTFPGEGARIKIQIPEGFEGTKVIAIANRKPPLQNFLTVGMLVDEDGNILATQGWGEGGSLWTRVHPGQVIYFEHVPSHARTASWPAEDVVYFR